MSALMSYALIFAVTADPTAGLIGGGTVIGLAVVLVKQVTNRGADYDSQIAGWKGLLADARQEADAARLEIGELRTENTTLRRDLTELRSSNAELRDEVAANRREVRTITAQLAQLQAIIDPSGSAAP